MDVNRRSQFITWALWAAFVLSTGFPSASDPREQDGSHNVIYNACSHYFCCFSVFLCVDPDFNLFLFSISPKDVP